MRHKKEGGAAAMTFVVLLIPVLLVCAGLVIDGGYALSAKRRALGYAESAARVAADSLDHGAVRTGSYEVNETVARTRAQAALATSGVTGDVRVSGREVTVEVTIVQQTAILAAFGMPSITVSSTATARSIDAN
ncbi:MAG: hypothetical protein GX678_05620 [Actinomycetales bacterium]|nr:hypothetical protein [Actinomycetales bacterium]